MSLLIEFFFLSSSSLKILSEHFFLSPFCISLRHCCCRSLRRSIINVWNLKYKFIYIFYISVVIDHWFSFSLSYKNEFSPVRAPHIIITLFFNFQSSSPGRRGEEENLLPLNRKYFPFSHARSWNYTLSVITQYYSSSPHVIILTHLYMYLHKYMYSWNIQWVY